MLFGNNFKMFASSKVRVFMLIAKLAKLKAREHLGVYSIWEVDIQIASSTTFINGFGYNWAQLFHTMVQY